MKVSISGKQTPILLKDYPKGKLFCPASDVSGDRVYMHIDMYGRSGLAVDCYTGDVVDLDERIRIYPRDGKLTVTPLTL